MLARKYRLAKRGDFKRIFKKGEKGKSRFFNICFLKNDLPNCRFAIVASLKISKKSTKRNYLKRQVREILYLNLFNFKQNYDVIVNILPTAFGQKYSRLSDDLLTLFKKTNLISK